MPRPSPGTTVRTSSQRKVLYSRPQRRLLSFLGALLYVLSAIALPSLHVGFHRNDHEHRGSGLRLLHDSLGDHQHLDAHRHRASSYPEASDEQPAELQEIGLRTAALTSGAEVPSFPRAYQSPIVGTAASSFLCELSPASLAAGAGHAQPGTPTGDPAHGYGSLVHFASAFLPSAAPATAPVAGPLLALLRFPPPTHRPPHSAPAATKDARGPPVLVAT